MKFIHILLFGFLFTSSQFVTADDEWSFIPSIAYQHKQLVFDQLYTDLPSHMVYGQESSQNGRKSHFRAELPTANVTFTSAYKKFYVAMKYEQNLADATAVADEQSPFATPNAKYFLNGPDHETNIARRDESITFGYNVWRGMNIFAGYMVGKTKLTPQSNCYVYLSSGSCMASNLAADLEQEGDGVYQQLYTEKGPFAGFSYGWQVSDAGTLSASFAYASMDGRYKDNYVIQDYIPTGWPSIVSGNQPFDFEGKSTGTSIGMTWSAPLSDSTAYFIDVRQQKYSMSATDKSPSYAGWNSVTVHTDETMLGLTMGMQFFF